MWKKSLSLCIVLSSGFLLLFLIMSFASAQGNQNQLNGDPDPDVLQVITPTIHFVTPTVVINNFQSDITILGEDFEIVLSGTEIITAPQVFLGNDQLKVIGGVLTQVITAQVPCGLTPLSYSLRVHNPSGGLARMESAVTIIQSPGIWTTGGPYGGEVAQIAFPTDNITTVYAVAPEAGLFSSTNGGLHWEHIFAFSNPYGPLQTFAIHPSQPDILYMGNSEGLYRRLNPTVKFQEILTGYVAALAYSPAPPYRLYVAINNELRTSIDDGASWSEPGEGLPFANSRNIAIHPITSTIAYGDFMGGSVYSTTDGGATWSALDTPGFPDEFISVFLDPHYPGTAGEPAHIYATSGHFGTAFFRSLDGGDTWEVMPLADGMPLNDFAFHPQTPGVIYGMNMHGLFRSNDYGATWQHLIGNFLDLMGAVYLHPDTGEPFMARGGYLGVWKCDENCDSYGEAWYPTPEGISALIPGRIAVSDYSPWQAYTSATDAGGYSTQNGGQQWAQAQVSPILINGNPMTAASVDPHDPCYAFLGSVDAAIYRTLDCGQNWSTHELVTIPGRRQLILAIAIDPFNPDTVYAGGNRSLSGYSEETEGVVFTSFDHGETWNEIDFSQPISQVASIVFDPQINGTIYIASGTRYGIWSGMGRIYKSIDNGENWEAYEEGLPGLPISALAIDPTDSNRLYAGLIDILPDDSYPVLYYSTDAGETWELLSTDFNNMGITDIYIKPTEPEIIYLSVVGDHPRHGLYRSKDRGNTWEHIEADRIEGNAYCLDGGVCAKGEKPMTLFVCAVSLPTEGESFRSLNGNELQYGAGVFQKTFAGYTSVQYLPLIQR